MVSQRSHHRESRTTSSSRCHNVEFGVGPFHQLWLHGRALSQADERLPVTASCRGSPRHASHDVRCYKCNRLGAKNPPGVSGRVGGRRGRLSACDRLRGVGDQASRRGTRQGTAAILEQKAVRVCTSEDRGGLNFALALGRVAQPDRASAFEAGGCRFKPCRGRQPAKRQSPFRLS